MQPLQARHILDLEEIAPGGAILAVSAGPESDVVILTADVELPYPRLPGVTISYRICRLVHGRLNSTNVPPTQEYFDFAQPLPSGRWILVRSRSQDSLDSNATVFSSKGAPERKFHAGDGIEDVQSDKDGRIWLGFFDEGVYSDAPMGHSGLVCLDEYGKLAFQYSQLPGWPREVPVIDHCYALNVIEDKEVWAYCSGGDFLVRIRSGELAGFWPKIPVDGACAFAVRSRTALFLRRRRTRTALYLVSLESLHVDAFCPADENGNALDLVSAFARGSCLYLRTERSLFSIDVEDVR